jgi:hypothetical protein
MNACGVPATGGGKADGLAPRICERQSFQPAGDFGVSKYTLAHAALP